ncbi:MAG: 5-methylcytosine-specific restriction endonuclease McrA [Cyclobacteriaceae bacterium]|jgi:5-methylcytosine-specific restriction endonuclease McrA
MNDKVLVLNQDYSPLTLCTVSRAFLLVFLEKAELLAADKNGYMRTVSMSYPKPSVIKIKSYVHVPYKGVVLSRYNILKRDAHKCQYCGTTKDLTLDHLIPRSKGGKSTWKNLVTACKRCNSRKGDSTPTEAGLVLQKPPFKPSYIMFLRNSVGELNDDWQQYLKKAAVA